MTLIERRERALSDRVDQMRELDEWHLFQDFAIGLLSHMGYLDVRLTTAKNDLGRDALAVTPDHRKCFVAVSLDCSLAKIRSDLSRFVQDPEVEATSVMVFLTWQARSLSE